MRTIAAFDWNKFFDRTSLVEAILQRDPPRIYAASDELTRDRYRHAIEELAERSRADECSVADSALELAESAARDTPDATWAGHVGYYLAGDGRAALEARIGFRPSRHDRLVRAVLGHPYSSYFGAIGLLCVLAWFGWGFLASRHAPAGLAVLLVVLALAPVSEFVISLVNALVVTIVPPRVLPKLSLVSGIGAERRTLVASCPSESDRGGRAPGAPRGPCARQRGRTHPLRAAHRPARRAERMRTATTHRERARRGIERLNARHG
jgi:cyclic beta-1,2-glucan synthetase